jgi:23S rRNA pseudouridine1911/1915/1917 synthase
MPPELSTTPTEFVVKPRMVGKRIDAYLSSRYPDYSRCVIQKVIDAGAVLINGKPTKASAKVRIDDSITIWLPELADDAPVPEDIPIPVIYEDESFVVVNKPPGMVTHPAKGHWKGTLVNALQFHFDKLSTIAGENRPGIVHRLDRDTSGLLIVAKDDKVHKQLAAQFENRTIRKEYLAIVKGEPSRDSDYIEKSIGFHPTDREKMAIRLPEDGAKEAVTFYKVIERFKGYAVVCCLPKTGRTHQIRIHLAYIGHPVVADKMYSGRSRLTMGDIFGPKHAEADRILLERQALHAYRLEFDRPQTGERLCVEAPLPDDLSATLQAFRNPS